MGTRNELARIGAEALGQNDALVAEGVKTVRDVIREALKAKGISEAVGFEISLTNGEKVTILSDSNPNMDRPASDVASTPSGEPNVAIKQSARAGYEQVYS